ncbi:MAG: BamA/TamA family outer membrane protein [Candidatus Neomarinimicrobiota bacterium]
MRVSKVITMLTLTTCTIGAKNVSVIVEVSGDSTETDRVVRTIEEPSEVLTLLDSLQAECRRRGLLRASLKWVSLEQSSHEPGRLKTVWEVSDPSPVHIDSIVILGADLTSPVTLWNIVRPVDSEVASQASLLRVQNLFQGYSFLNLRGKPFYATYGEGRVALMIPVEENFQNTFSGTVGYLPRSDAVSQVTGDIQLHVENPFGTASQADLLWQRKDRQSQILSLGYEEPFVWKLNLGARFRFFQNLQDGLYVTRKTHLSGVKSYSSTGKWSLGAENTTVKVTPGGDSLGLKNHTLRSLVVENEWERRDDSWNPTRGFHLRWSSEAGNFSTPGYRSEILFRIQSRFEILRSLSGRWLAAVGGMGGLVHVTGGRSVPPAELFTYGGASTLRGYREQLFRSSAMVIGWFELRYRQGRMSRVYSFVDVALHNVSPKLPFSGGLGIQYKTPLGFLRVEYALNRDDRPSRGKIHMQLLGRF